MLNISNTQKIFRGGIQKGTTAFDEDSKRLDGNVKAAVLHLTEQFSNLNVIRQMSKEMKLELIGDDCLGFAPDGGAWFKDGKLVAVFEAKKQGNHGNAYERWWDNAVTAKHINPDVVYVTFCTGEGAVQNGVLHKLARKANIMLGDKFKFHLKVSPFTQEEIEEIMIKTLSEVV